MNELKSFESEAFDKKFINEIIERYQKAIKVMSAISEHSEDIETQNLVKNLTPKLNELHSEAKKIKAVRKLSIRRHYKEVNFFTKMLMTKPALTWVVTLLTPQRLCQEGKWYRHRTLRY